MSTRQNLSIHGKDHKTGKPGNGKYNPCPAYSNESNSPRAKRRRMAKGKKK